MLTWVYCCREDLRRKEFWWQVSARVRPQRRDLESVPGAARHPTKLIIYNIRCALKRSCCCEQEALTRLGRVLVEFDDDRSIQVSGFGDAKTPDNAVFSFTPENPMDGCKSFNEIWRRYHDLTPTIALGEKPASLGPVIRHATAVAREVTGFHMLIILVSSQLSNKHLVDTAQAIVDASMLPLCRLTCWSDVLLLRFRN